MSFAAIRSMLAVRSRAELGYEAATGRSWEQLVRANATPCDGLSTPFSTASRVRLARAARPRSTAVLTATRRRSNIRDRVHEASTRTPETLTMSITATFDASVDDGLDGLGRPAEAGALVGAPPTYPATVLEHELEPGGPRHLRHDRPGRRQAWRLVARARQSSRRNRLRVRGRLRRRSQASPTRAMPTTIARVSLSRARRRPHDDGDRDDASRAIDAMEQMVAMGMEEGITLAVGQIDGLLA